ncbi:MAG: isoprenyl transferase [Bacteroidota bacterium]
MSLKESIDLTRLPNHIAIIMDGNGRWAKKHGHIRTIGHQHGVKPVREVSEACAELGVKHVTLYAFSTENWNRPIEEVNALMELLVLTINAEIPTLQKNNIKLNAFGDLSKLPENCRKQLNDAIEITSSNSRMTLHLALSYSSRWEIMDAAKKFAKDCISNNISPEAIDEKLFSSFLATKNIPDPELMIRTSGEYRISNFLLWQIAYSELYFTQTLWPDFDRNELYNAILDYQKRERRFGKTSEQLTQTT